MQTSPESTSSNKLYPWLLLGLIVVGAAVLIWKTENQPKPISSEEAQKSASEQIEKARLHLDDSAPVIGVSFNGKNRAYPLKLLMRPDQHVVNDLYGDKPLTVTYCDVDKCVRVFTDPARNLKLNILVGGPNPLRPGKMLLRTGNGLFWQDTGAPLEATNKSQLPFVKVEHVETTWGEWRGTHPDSERYIGKGEFLPNKP